MTRPNGKGTKRLMGGVRTIRIAGFDPGLSRTGWGVIAVEGSRLTHVANGALTTRASDELCVRLAALHRAIIAVIEEHAPDAVAVHDRTYKRYRENYYEQEKLHDRQFALRARAQAAASAPH